MGFVFYTSIVLFIIVCLFLILLILIQKGRGGGLASAFGGAGGNTAFGSKTGDVLTWATSIVFGVFLLLAIVLNLVANSQQAKAGGTGKLTPQVPVAPGEPGIEHPAPADPTPLPDAEAPEPK